MLDFNSSHMLRAGEVQAIHDALDAVLVRVEGRRQYVGASSIGSPCERQVQFEFMGEPHDEGWRHSARTLRIFQRGHEVERWAARWLQDAGFDLRLRKPNGQPYGFSVADDLFKGHADGVITLGPGIAEAPALWEHKAVGSKSWKAISSRGVAKAKPEYADQIATYQAYIQLPAPALFMATNTDTMEIYLELVPFDVARAQAASDRAVAIIRDTQAGALRPRPTSTPDFYACSGCAFKRRCWEG